jgi:hypothetical protein
MNEGEVESEVEYWRRIYEYLHESEVERALGAVFWRLVDEEVSKVDLVPGLYLTFEGGQIMLNDAGTSYTGPLAPVVLHFMKRIGSEDVRDGLDALVQDWREAVSYGD